MIRLDTKYGRFYYRESDNKARVSVTTVLGQMPKAAALINYLDKDATNGKHTFDSQSYGTLLHLKIEDLLHKKDVLHSEIDLPYNKANELIRDLVSIKEFLKTHNVEPIAIEQMLYDDKMAGTVDLVCYMDYGKERVKAIVDFKSSKKGFYVKNAYQLEIYRNMYNRDMKRGQYATEIFNVGPINWVDEPGYNIKRWTGRVTQADIDALWNVYEAFGVTDPNIQEYIARVSSDMYIQDYKSFNDITF